MAHRARSGAGANRSTPTGDTLVSDPLLPGHVEPVSPRLERFVHNTFNGFGCGPDSPLGLVLEMREDTTGRLSGQWMPSKREEGPPGAVHGGVQAVLADAMAGWGVARHLLGRCEPASDRVPLPTTLRLDLEYHEPLSIKKPVILDSPQLHREDRRIHVEVTLGHPGMDIATSAQVVYHLSRKHTLDGDTR